MIDMKYYVLKKNTWYRQVENFIYLLQKNAIEYALGDMGSEDFVKNQKIICNQMNRIFDVLKNSNKL